MEERIVVDQKRIREIYNNIPDGDPIGEIFETVEMALGSLKLIQAIMNPEKDGNCMIFEDIGGKHLFYNTKRLIDEVEEHLTDISVIIDRATVRK